MTAHRGWRGLALVLLVAPTILLAAVASGQQPPTAELSSGRVNPGDEVQVRGTEWQPGTVVQAEVCGNNALNGSLDCNRSDAVAFGVPSDGVFAATLKVNVPPVPCPCVVSLTSPSTATRIHLPIQIFGAPMAEPTRVAVDLPFLSVSDVVLSGGDSNWSAFGLRNDRVATITIRNVGDTAVFGLSVQALLDGAVASEAEIDVLQPGEVSSVDLPVAVPPLQWGSARVEVTVETAGETITNSASFSTAPWALALVLGTLAVAGMAWLGAALLRRRARRSMAVDIDRAVSKSVDRLDSASTLPTTAHQADELAALLEAALIGVGPVPPGTDTEQLARRIAETVAAEFGRRHGMEREERSVIEQRLTQELGVALERAVGAH